MSGDDFSFLNKTEIVSHLFSSLDSVSHDRLIRVCHVDYDRDIALIVLDKSHSTEKLVAAARLTKGWFVFFTRVLCFAMDNMLTIHLEHGRNSAEFSVLVADDYQGEYGR